MDQVDELKNDITNRDISLTWKQVELDEEKKEHEETKKELQKLKQKFEVKIPATTRKETETKLKMCDDYTKGVIIKYLDLDTHELIKNIAGTVNSHNSSDAINHMDGWLARNFALKSLLEASIDRRKEFYDKMEWESKKKK